MSGDTFLITVSGSQRDRRGSLPDNEACFEYLRNQRWSAEVSCPQCRSGNVIKKGTTRKDAQRYRCRGCDRIFNDLSETVFANHQLSLAEMFYVLRWREIKSTAQLAEDLGRTYKTVLNVVNQMSTVSDRNAAFGPAEISKVFER